jgi:DNA-binding MarR family transcriptional regulator
MNSSVVPIITLWEEYSKTSKDADPRGFARWILKDVAGKSLPTSLKTSKSSRRHLDRDLDDAGKAMLLINRLHSMMKKVSKPILKKIGFAKDQEYGVLIQIYLLKNPNKKEVAQQLLLENSTTVEMIKRLVKRGFIREVLDSDDNRAMRLSLTDKGMQKLMESYEGMAKVHANFLDCLSNQQKKQLVKLLEEVEQFQSQTF